MAKAEAKKLHSKVSRERDSDAELQFWSWMLWNKSSKLFRETLWFAELNKLKFLIIWDWQKKNKDEEKKLLLQFRSTNL